MVFGKTPGYNSPMKVALTVALLCLLFTGCTHSTLPEGGIQGRVLLPLCGKPTSFQGVVTVHTEKGETFVFPLSDTGEFTLPPFTSSYLVFVTWQGGTLAGGFSPGDPPVITAFTTAQVIIYEEARKRYPQAVFIRDIPHFLPPQDFVHRVENALASCEDPMTSQDIREMASRLVDVWF